MENRDIPAAGERYRHFKNGLYQIVTIARHSETGEQMVVYQALYGDFGVYVRPLEMFMSEVEHGKYPQAAQKYRFEKVAAVRQVNADTAEAAVKTDSRTDREDVIREQPQPVMPEYETVQEMPRNNAHEMLMEFLDADTYAQKLNILRGMKKHIDNKTIHDMAVSLDIVLNEKSLEEQIGDIENCLKTYARFECNRLR